MKKIIMIGLILALAASLSVSVFATAGGFVSSPSRNQAPDLIDEVIESDECEAEVVITAYGDRDELGAEVRQQIEDAYATIVNNADLTSLNGALGDKADDLGVDASDLAVSDLFNVGVVESEGHDGHGDFQVTVKADTLDNFVSLLRYYNGEWEVVDDAEVMNDGKYLAFSVSEPAAAYAIVVNTGDAPQEKDVNPMAAVIIASSITCAVVLPALMSYSMYRYDGKK